LGAAAFTQADVAKVLKGAKAAGLAPTSVEIDRDGKIVARFDPDAAAAPNVNEWDTALYGETKRPSGQR
jgi:hypothetical protein